MTNVENKPLPLIAESSTSESTTVEVVMNDLKDGLVVVPDYQRDSDQWDDEMKSLLIESVINNLSIPAFFFEVRLDHGVERNEVIDGQQRLTTMRAFYDDEFPLVPSDDAPYLTPHHVHYAGKRFRQLPETYKQAFKKYRLAVIKLRNLKDEMRLEIFRRINQGGTPLSGQDIRLAYYGNESKSLALIRVVGIYDPERQGSKRILSDTQKQYDLEFPWRDSDAADTWKDWWEEKSIARGQTASEAFLWSLVVAEADKLGDIMDSDAILKQFGITDSRTIDAALDAFCAQLHYQDTEKSMPTKLMTFEEMRDKFFPFFQEWIKRLLGREGTSLPVTKYRAVSTVIGAAYRSNVAAKKLREQQWTNVVEFVRKPADIARQFGCEWPISKGKWEGPKGYRKQMEAARTIVKKIAT